MKEEKTVMLLLLAKYYGFTFLEEVRGRIIRYGVIEWVRKNGVWSPKYGGTENLIDYL